MYMRIDGASEWSLTSEHKLAIVSTLVLCRCSTLAACCAQASPICRKCSPVIYRDFRTILYNVRLRVKGHPAWRDATDTLRHNKLNNRLTSLPARRTTQWAEVGQ